MGQNMSQIPVLERNQKLTFSFFRSQKRFSLLSPIKHMDEGIILAMHRETTDPDLTANSLLHSRYKQAMPTYHPDSNGGAKNHQRVKRGSHECYEMTSV